MDKVPKFNTCINTIGHRAHYRAYAINKFFVSRDLSTASCFHSVCSFPAGIRITGLVPVTGRSQNLLNRFNVVLQSVYQVVNIWLTYKDLKLLHIDNLEKRRLNADLAFTYKIIFGLVKLNITDFFKLKTHFKTGVHVTDYLLPTIGSSSSKVFKCPFVKPWTSLPANNDSFKSFTSFKCLLNNCDIFKLCKY